MSGEQIGAPKPVDLVAKPEEDSAKLKGAGIFDTTEGLIDHLNPEPGEDLDAFALAMDGVSMSLDVLSMVMNPLGELVKAGVGWLMEHLDFIREPLDMLTGHPDLVQQAAQTWNNIAAELQAVAGDYQGALSTTSDWDGDAANAYRVLAMQYTASLHEVADNAKTAANWITTGGMVVAAARAIVYDIIAGLISDVITRALLAMASSWFTLGGSVAAFTASIFVEVGRVIAKIQHKIGNLLQAIQRFLRQFQVLGKRTEAVADAMATKASKMGFQGKKAVETADRSIAKAKAANLKLAHTPLAPDSTGGDWLLRHARGGAERMETTTTGKIVDNMGVKIGKEGGKAAAEDYDQYSGGKEDKGKVRPPSGTISGSLDDD